MIPDYRERAQLMCEEAYARLYNTGKYYGDDDGFGMEYEDPGHYTTIK